MRMRGKDTLFNVYWLLVIEAKRLCRKRLWLIGQSITYYPPPIFRNISAVSANFRNIVHRPHVPQRHHVDPAALDAIDAAALHGVELRVGVA